MEHVDHVLIVDDDREIRELVGNYLKKNGLRVTLAADGRQMRAFLEANTVDLIVLDIMMPGDDGLLLCRELRVGKHKATPVLMLTARNDETDRIIGLEMGADDYLTKPFSARELLARINAVLRRTRMLPPNLQREREQPADRLRPLAAGHHRAPPARRRRHPGRPQRRRVPPAARVPRSSAAGAQPRPVAQPDAGPRGGHLRPLHRPAGQPPAPAPAATTPANPRTSRPCAARAMCSPWPCDWSRPNA